MSEKRKNGKENSQKSSKGPKCPPEDATSSRQPSKRRSSRRPVTRKCSKPCTKQHKEESCYCMNCDRVKSGPMVQCDNCHNWVHFKCAHEVSPDTIKDVKWYCEKCKQKKRAKDEKKKVKDEKERMEQEQIKRSKSWDEFNMEKLRLKRQHDQDKENDHRKQEAIQIIKQLSEVALKKGTNQAPLRKFQSVPSFPRTPTALLTTHNSLNPVIQRQNSQSKQEEYSTCSHKITLPDACSWCQLKKERENKKKNEMHEKPSNPRKKRKESHVRT